MRTCLWGRSVRLSLLLFVAFCWAGLAQATQTIVLDWDAPSAEAAPLIGYAIRGRQTLTGTATTLATVDVDTAATLTLADGPWFLYVRGCWAPAATNCVDPTWTDPVGPVGNGATATVTCGANGTCNPNTFATVLKGQTTQITATPSGGYTAEVGGTCGGALAGTTYTTAALTQANCTVVAQFTVGGGADIVSPTVSSASVNAAGTTLTVGFSEAVSLNGALLTLSTARGAFTLSNPSTGSASSHTWTISPAVLGTDVLYLGYEQPGDGIQDPAGNDLLSFSGRAVTNSSTVANITSLSLTPADLAYYPRDTTSVLFTAVTDAAAECVLTADQGAAWGAQSAMDTSDDLTHTLSVTVQSNRIYRRCVTCRSAATQAVFPTQCRNFAVEPAPRF